MTRGLLLGLLLLAACGERDAPARPEGPAAPGSAAPTRPPVAAGPAAFVGRWAASPELCTGGAWVFAPTRLITAGEVACDFQKVTADAEGWSVQAACTAEAPPQPATLRLARAAGGGLAVSGGPFEPVTLKLCGENWGTAGTATTSPTNP